MSGIIGDIGAIGKVLLLRQHDFFMGMCSDGEK